MFLARTNSTTSRATVVVPALLRRACAKMVTLVVATSADPASVGPASAFLSMPGWSPGPNLPDEGMESYANGGVRLVKHGQSIVAEDDLDRRWEEATGEHVDEVVFLSRHTAVSNRPALTVHPIGVPHLREGDVLPQGGRPGWAGLPSPRIGPWLRLLKRIAEAQGLIPEFEVTLEATHHGPVVSTPTMFVEIGSTEEHWKRQDAAQVVALLLWEGLGLDGGGGVGQWNRNNDKSKVLLGVGGGHYAPRHMDIVQKDGVYVGHILSGYSLPMEDPGKQNGSPDNGVGGTWKQAIRVSYEATKSAFPGGEVIAHLDQKLMCHVQNGEIRRNFTYQIPPDGGYKKIMSFKSWQKNAITSFLAEQNIKVGKPGDFF